MLVRINKRTHLNPVVTTQRGYDGQISKLPRIKRICVPKNLYPAPKGWGPPIGIQVLFSMTSRTYAHIWKIRNIIMIFLGIVKRQRGERRNTPGHRHSSVLLNNLMIIMYWAQ
ncbi:hypothetical protein O181_091786 [Austropuccinia psidii MF-1]|uniref:Uncharacterized protein n=1 Tax=Austropuccinia psidii MF-1 TaxID=1389203 RepID=A0A9Q3IY43_9BASI|nr:hypothetical protein [Austropuccinia psidii MF-1]